jgi:predicted flap endonuclease-1-like 5' DNA nuclease
MGHYFTELLIYILLAYFAGCLLGGYWGRTTRVDPAKLMATPQPAGQVDAQLQAEPEPTETFNRRAVPAVTSTSFDQSDNQFIRPVGLTSPRGGMADDLTRVVGDDDSTVSGLKSIGVYHYDQIANWSEEQSNWVNNHMKFDRRVGREQWVKKARLLSDRKEAEFQRLFGSATASAAAADVSFRVQSPSAPPADDLKRLKGIGPENEKALNALGIYRYEQIAIWTRKDIQRVEGHLEFDGRIEREEWVKQAQLLEDEEYDRFEKLFGEPKRTTKSTKPAPAQPKSAPRQERKSSSVPSGKPKGLSAPRSGKADNLQRLNGIGPKYEKILHSLGFFHFDQIAAWTPEQVEWVDNHLNFNGRIKREEWIRQARLLADGKEVEFEKDYGSGGLKNSEGTVQPGTRTRRT